VESWLPCHELRSRRLNSGYFHWLSRATFGVLVLFALVFIKIPEAFPICIQSRLDITRIFSAVADVIFYCTRNNAMRFSQLSPEVGYYCIFGGNSVINSNAKAARFMHSLLVGVHSKLE